MLWVIYGLISVLFWGGWAFMGKLALRHINWAQVCLLYGISTVIIFGIILALTNRQSGWGLDGLWTGILTGLLGTAGLITFYLALDRGNASLVVPLIGVYPIITAVLSMVFLGERISALQSFGIGLAGVAVVLISLGR